MKGITNPVVCVVRFGKVHVQLCTQLTQVLRYITFAIVRKLEFIMAMAFVPSVQIPTHLDHQSPFDVTKLSSTLKISWFPVV